MNLIKKYWLPAVLVLQFIILLAVAWYFYTTLHTLEVVVNNQGNALTQIITFLQNATKK